MSAVKDRAYSAFNTCMDLELGRVIDLSHCRVSVGSTEVAGLVYCDNAVIFAKSPEFLVMALAANPLDFRFHGSRPKFMFWGTYYMIQYRVSMHVPR